ncbi:F-box protein PP2-B10-like isoform X4 [Telopea speciosissima]|uniref:F-box protein PP2-B10-like isoform X4 n=1 Tax=Telopea speciosissima TaxID=54955 RepID=UPI001CC39106|nr:F-box protein PP2-B10-like isoform X4 [Telopea speciosissima]
MQQWITFDLQSLPEGCISNILSLTSPPDACRSSVVSSGFRSAANSDSVWEKFLPSDIHQILSSSVSPSSLSNFSSKKELFLHLCDNPLPLDNGSKTFALEKCSGKKCYMIAAKELSIIWGDTPTYWKWRPDPESRFSEVAELLDVCWLEIRGKLETRLLSPNTTYRAYTVFKLTETPRGLGILAEASVKLANGVGAEEGEVKSVYLDPRSVPSNTGAHRQQRGINRGIFRLFPWSARSSNALNPEEAVRDPRPEGQVPRERWDGWMEIDMGEFFNDRGDDGEVEMSLLEVKRGNWKSGLIIQGIELRPKENQ